MNLMEMGFEESEAISALRVAGNNQDTAVSKNIHCLFFFINHIAVLSLIWKNIFNSFFTCSYIKLMYCFLK